jgi:hypothetical protein
VRLVLGFLIAGRPSNIAVREGQTRSYGAETRAVASYDAYKRLGSGMRLWQQAGHLCHRDANELASVQDLRTTHTTPCTICPPDPEPNTCSLVGTVGIELLR